MCFNGFRHTANDGQAVKTNERAVCQFPSLAHAADQRQYELPLGDSLLEYPINSRGSLDEQQTKNLSNEYVCGGIE